MTVLFLGAAHAIPVVATAAFSGGWGLTLLAASGTAFFAFATGGSQWVVFDLAGIGLGLFFASSIISQHQRNRANAGPTPTSTPQQSSTPAAGKKEESGLLTIIGVIVGLGVVLYNAGTRSPEPGAQRAASEYLARRDAAQSASSKPNYYAQPAKKEPVQTPVSHKRDVRDCLALSANEAIARCTEGRK